MDKKTSNQDCLGNKFGDKYSLIITDPTFERRLKMYDPDLKLMFDQFTKRWVILAWREDNTGWQIILRCEDDFGNPMPLGEHVFFQLNWLRENNDQKLKNPDRWYDGLLAEGDAYAKKQDDLMAKENQYRIITDYAQWDKGFRELRNEPVSDAIAGYPKIKNKPKGIICRPT